MTTIATLFSGGEGVGVGARAAGLDYLWGLEWRPEIVKLAQDNDFPVELEDVTGADPCFRALPDVLHASPPCPSYSAAKIDAAEQQNDLVLADATMRFVAELRPYVFTLENVWGYHDSRAFEMILTQLYALGYRFDYWRLNAANFGVPQQRRRLFLVACRGGRRPQRPTATHGSPDKLTPLFDDREPWVGWFAAIKDLIPSLPEDRFAPWQVERMDGPLPVEATVLVTDQSESEGAGVQMVPATEPAPTVRSGNKRGVLRAHIGGDVYRLNTRALARLQSFPNNYKIPVDHELAVEVIGNAVPPRMYQALIEQVLGDELHEQG